MATEISKYDIICSKIDEILSKPKPNTTEIRDLFKEMLLLKTTLLTGEMRSKIWIQLMGIKKNTTHLGSSVRDVVEDLENQKVVNADVKRSKLSAEDDRKLLGQMLTFYCKRRGVRYAQGLHEILVPFMQLQEPRLPVSCLRVWFLFNLACTVVCVC